jgi:N utilization substance protein B
VSDIYDQVLNDDDEVPAYLTQLVDGVIAHQDELDASIQKLLDKKWRLSRLAKTDLVILRIALYEMQFVDNVPDAVAINEALELTKTFSDDKSKGFVNGVLGNFEKQAK